MSKDRDYRSPFMTGATPRAHVWRPLRSLVVEAINTALKAAASEIWLEKVLLRVEGIVDRYHQSPLKIEAYPCVETQLACSSAVVEHLKAALRAINARDRETKKRSRSHFAEHDPESARRREIGRARERAAIEAMLLLIGAHEYAHKRANLYRRRGRRMEDEARVTVANELVHVWEEATGERLSISRNRLCSNGKLVTRGAPSAVFFAAILRHGCGLDLTDAQVQNLMREGRERVVELREPVSLAGSQSAEDRYQDLADGADD